MCAPLKSVYCRPSQHTPPFNDAGPWRHKAGSPTLPDVSEMCRLGSCGDVMVRQGSRDVAEIERLQRKALSTYLRDAPGYPYSVVTSLGFLGLRA